jgi:hypothetical protein
LIGRHARANDDLQRVPPQHGRRYIDFRCCWLAQAAVAHVSDDTNDLEGIVGGCAEAR